MALERQAVQGLQQVQSTGGPRMASIAAKQVGTPQLEGNPSAFLEDLFSAAGSLAKVGTDIMNQAVEDDKVVQYDRALRGLMPTEDATVGGTRAHMLVGLQNDVSAQTMQLTDLAQRFQGTDAEWEQMVIDSRNAIQNKMWQQYPELLGNKEAMRMVTNSFMEQQPKIFAAREGAKIAKQNAERTQAMQDRLLLATDGLSGESLDSMLKQLQQEAVTMQLTKPEFEAMVTEVALTRAAVGDDTFIQATKNLKDANGVSLYQREGKLQTGEIQADRTWAAQNQVAVFEKKDAAIKAYESGDITREQLLQVMQNHNEMTGGTAWSDSEIQSIFNKVAKKAAQEANLQDLIKRGEGGSPLGLQDISKEQREDYADALVGVYTKLAQDEIEKTGATGEQAEAIRGKYEQLRYMKLGQQLIQDPNIGKRYEALMQMSSANLKDMKAEPEALQTLMRARDSVPEDARRAVMGDKAYAFTDNYDLGIQMGYEPGQAIEFAQAASRGEKLPGGTRKELSSLVDDVVGDVATGSWLTKSDNINDMGRDLMRQEAEAIATSMKVSGFNDDTIKRNLKSYLEGSYTQMAEGFFSSGVLVKGDTRMLPNAIGANPKDVPLALKTYIQNNKQALLDASGGLSEDDLYFDIDSKRGMFVIRAGSARTPVTPSMPLSEIKGQSLLKQAYEEAEKRPQAVPDPISGYAEAYKASQKVTAKEVGKMGIASFLVSPAFAAGERLPSNFEFGYERNNKVFYDKLARTENANGAGLDKVAGVYTPYKDAHGQSVGFGHFITPEEKKNGYIVIDGEKVPFEEGRSQLTPERAMALLKQDAKSHLPSTSDWAVPFDAMHPGVQRGLQDLTYNLGKNGIKNAPRAYAAFKAGKFTDGFIEMLGTASTEGMHSPALLARRADAYNMAMEASGLPKITDMEVTEGGQMRVKFSGSLEGMVNKGISGKIGKDGWYTVYESGKMTPGTKPGRTRIK